MKYRTSPVVLAAMMLGAATAPAEDRENKVDERNLAVTASLDGKLHVQDPVPLAGPFPALLRTAKVGDRLMLQVVYSPEGSVIPKKVTAKAENSTLTVLDVLPTEHALYLQKLPEKNGTKSGTYFAVLVKANAEGNCSVVLTCEMSDGSTKKVPFQFKVEK